MTTIAEFNALQAAIKAKQLALDREVADLDSGFKAIIWDKSIPLLERWSFWCEADPRLKSSESSLPDGNLTNKYIHYYCDAPEVYGRGKTLYWSEMMESVVGDDEIHPYDDWSVELIEKLLEEILKKNVDEFAYDW